VFTKLDCGNEIEKCVSRTSGIENYAKLGIEKSSKKSFKWFKRSWKRDDRRNNSMIGKWCGAGNCRIGSFGFPWDLIAKFCNEVNNTGCSYKEDSLVT